MEVVGNPVAPFLLLSKTLKRSSSSTTTTNHYHLHFQNFHRRSISRFPSSTRCFSSPPHLPRRHSNQLFLFSFLEKIFRISPPPPSTGMMKLASISSSALGHGSGGGGDGGVSGGGGAGGGDEGSSGGETDAKSIAVESEDPSALGADVIVLDVGGMSCGGCAASVKRILESLPQVSSASVNLATEIAVVWANPEAKASQNWKEQLGDKLASHLTTCGFKTKLRGQGHSIDGKINLKGGKDALSSTL